MLSILVSILVPATAREAPPVRIMPFGDSLTIFDCRLNAFTSADDEPLFQPLARIPASSIYPQGTFFVVAPGGYRGHLASLMGDPSLYPANVQALPAWSYVGREYLCGAHEGYPGATIEWLGEHVATPAVASAQPDIVLFLGGTNDFFWSPPKGSRSPLEVADRLRRLLNASVAGAASVGAASPTFLLGTVTPVNMTRCRLYHTARWHPGDCPEDMNGNIHAYNRLLPDLVAEQKTAGRDVRLVQLPTSFALEDQWIWGIHFNSSGFEKIAEAWHAAILQTPVMQRAMGASSSVV